MCINDGEGFINKIKNEALNKTEKKLRLDISDMHPLLPNWNNKKNKRTSIQAYHRERYITSNDKTIC